ncbi:hypothetical protein [Thomasclavelia cocleata]|uniref:hypothetical protein n=1 Tax=Thomasclavelia cocleata TaxID=69824 RepID=UPI00256F3D45|nr:hypothetical protein [Thomasclavelia cocleata]
MNIVKSKNFCVVQKGKKFGGVYEYCLGVVGPLLTSGPSLSSACKKMHLLQKGYDIRKELDDEGYSY